MHSSVGLLVLPILLPHTELCLGDYCDVYLTHDSMSVRKAHNSGRNHERNVLDYYQRTLSVTPSTFRTFRALLTSVQRNRPRKSSIGNRLHYLVLRSRRPSRRQPYAGTTRWPSNGRTRLSTSAICLPWYVTL